MIIGYDITVFVEDNARACARGGIFLTVRGNGFGYADNNDGLDTFVCDRRIYFIFREVGIADDRAFSDIDGGCGLILLYFYVKPI